ncbi:TRAP transporter large permease [Thalassovita mangrovi]|uniref:TRAP transporter large permease protein n=1 Tax=Thalassovita mangrovi TaxID=2692236 RepID=A0A6L8LWN2_9RHOB|nr:TRAP transporter large permease [Thalassovita mangrovi]MYM57579.1 TRAP transporter large permease subunit [Thalassovita mangrovi]
MTIALIALAILFLLLLLEVPIAIAMLAVGIGGFASIVGLPAAGYMAADSAYRTVHSYNLSVIPLFILMGNLINRAEISKELFDFAYRFVGHLRGGLAIATVISGGMFSAVCGSSLATAATMGRIAYPSMKRYGYDDGLASGSIAAAGTLGIMVPPSVALIVYGVLTQTDIGKLFIAGVVPGILGALLYIGAVMFSTRVHPNSGPAGERSSWGERFNALKSVGAVVVLFGIVIGGIYGNLFTPTEAAGVGSVGALAITLWRRKLTLRSFFETLGETAVMSATIFFILVGAQIFGNFINVAGFTAALQSLVAGLDLPAWAMMMLIILLYVVLGCVLESMSMLLLTIPIIYPLVLSLGFDPIWFGIIVVTLIEIALITPPVGMNVYILQGVLPGVPLKRMFAGVGYFVLADIIRIALLLLLPGLVLWLPGLM